jgi:hypothetical protein
MSELDDWVAAATEELGLKSGDVQPKIVLDVAREVAHQVLRPAAPLTAYLMGVAVGRGTDPADATARISALAQTWPGREGPETPAGLGREGPETLAGLRREGPETSAGLRREGPETSAGLGREGPETLAGLGREGPEASARAGREDTDTVADPPTQ